VGSEAEHFSGHVLGLGCTGCGRMRLCWNRASKQRIDVRTQILWHEGAGASKAKPLVPFSLTCLYSPEAQRQDEALRLEPLEPESIQKSLLSTSVVYQFHIQS
jgi:hypothetical protein